MIELVKGDITNSKCEAIVNAANNSLMGGGGVDGAIHRVAGIELLKECATLGGCNTGEAKITKGYNLNAKYVIHTVGPVWSNGILDDEEKLESCYRCCLELVKKHEIKSIAFPAISTGIYNFPSNLAAKIALESLKKYSKEFDLHLDIEIYCFDGKNFLAYESII